MKQKTNLRKVFSRTLPACAIVLVCWKAFGLGADYSNDMPVRSTGHWPGGMVELVNVTNRVHGFFVNDSDVFFFSGSASNLTLFLQDYSKIQGVVDQHRLILHEGVGEAKSPWGKTGKPCDWKLTGRGNGWKAGVITNYILEVHFWTGGKIGLSEVSIPKSIEVSKEK
jgi:hypothetical protein